MKLVAQLKLKRLLSRKSPVTALVENLMTTLDAAVVIQDTEGAVLLGTLTDSQTPSFTIQVDGTPIGTVQGSDKAALVAQLLSHLANEEAQKRALAEEVLERYREVNLFSKLAEKLSTSLELKTVAAIILDEANRLLPTESTSGVVVVQFNAGEALRPIAVMGNNFDPQQTYQAGCGIIGSLIQEGKPEIVDHIQQDSRYVPGDGTGQALVCAPLKGKDGVLGVLALTSTTNVAYTASDLKLLNILAAQATAALENAIFFERKVQEAQEREARRLQEQEIKYLKEINKLKDEVVRMVSHDLKNPIGVIIGYVDMLTDHFNEMEATQRLNYLQRIRYSADRMKALVTDLLDLARIEEGLSFTMQPVSLSEFLAKCVEDFEFPAQEKAIHLSFNPPPALMLSIDPDRMSQVVHNLISNAIKYTPAHGQVEVRTLVQPHTVMIEIADSGVGIPEKDIPHLFEKFYRVHANDPMAEGTGLGLAIVKAIVEQHQGTIAVTSKVGVGSTFAISLPVPN